MKSQIQVILLLITTSISFFAMATEESSPEEIAPQGVKDTQPANSEGADTKEANDQLMATDQPPIPQHYLPSTIHKRATALLDHMSLMGREDEVITLSSPEEDFYGLYLPQASRQPQGAILILHDEQQHGHWPEIIGPLREYLPLFGWSTLTIELPDQVKRQRIPRDIPTLAASDNQTASKQNASEQEGNKTKDSEASADTETSESENQEPDKQEAKDNAGPENMTAEEITNDIADTPKDDNEPALPRLDKLPDLPAAKTESLILEEEIIDHIADYHTQNRQRINTAINYLQQKNQFNLVIIGFGRGASWAIDYVHQQMQQEAEPKGLTLITIDAQPNFYDKDLINRQLADVSLPYLDLLQSKKSLLAKQARKRLAIMHRNNNPNYQQIMTQEISSYHELENPTNRRIRGWIKTNASGTQISAKR
jgi:hypothetical protein